MSTRLIKIDGKDVRCRELGATEIRDVTDVWDDGQRCVVSWGQPVGDARVGQIWRPVAEKPPVATERIDAMLTEARRQAHSCADVQRAGSCEAGKWISIGERLPEDDRCVLVWHKHAQQPVIGYCYADLKLWLETGEDIPITNVTHWMPLPEGPKVSP